MTKVKDLTEPQLDKLLSVNKTSLKPGMRITRSQLITMLGITDISKNPTKGSFKELQRENLRLVGLQRKINDLMARNGLYLKSRNYYTSFEVTTNARTKAQIVTYAAKVDANEELENELDRAMVNRMAAGTWGRYNRSFTSKGKPKQSMPSRTRKTTRQDIARNRLKI